MDDWLSGANVVLTGATGFVGQAVLERLLADHIDTRIVLVLRDRDGVAARDRLAHLLAQPVFASWQARVGRDEAERAVRDRVTLLPADISREVPELPADVTAVVHCASTVSFDPAIDEAFRTNVVGTVNLYNGVLRSGGHPHLVHVSTAYVAGSRKGIVTEDTLEHQVDWEAELAAALAARGVVEQASRHPELLERVRRQAVSEHRMAGPQAVAAAAEQKRREIVAARLVDYGRSRARSLGWPDVYTLTKALGERAAEQLAHALPLSVVRPAIIESALRHPYPGWMDGFKMADPIILAYGRGILPDFPGVPDGSIDIVPVDLVVNALLAVATTPPVPGRPAYYHVGSGARNPLTFHRLYELVREYFEEHPLPDDQGRGHIRVPQWSFPGGGSVERSLRTAERLVGAVEQALLRLPGGGRVENWQGRLHRQQRKLDFLRRYLDLYGAYVDAEVTYTDDRTLALHQTLHAEERSRVGFDSAVVDWTHYVKDVHCPAVSAVLRAPPARTSARTPLTIPDGHDVVAVFDLEGTILASNVVEAYVWARLLDMPRTEWPGELFSVARSLPKYLLAESRDRGEFLRTFLRRYEGASTTELRRLVGKQIGDLLLRRLWPQAVRRIRRHRAAGHRTVLVTGTIDLLVEPLRALFDEMAASRLHAVDGRCTGFLEQPPLVGEARAAWLRRWAELNGTDLSRSWAYGDHYSDRSVLELVGNPVAVNPDPRLYRHAKQRHWPIEHWKGHVRGPVQALVEAAREADR